MTKWLILAALLIGCGEALDGPPLLSGRYEGVFERFVTHRNTRVAVDFMPETKEMNLLLLDTKEELKGPYEWQEDQTLKLIGFAKPLGLTEQMESYQIERKDAANLVLKNQAAIFKLSSEESPAQEKGEQKHYRCPDQSFEWWFYLEEKLFWAHRQDRQSIYYLKGAVVADRVQNTKTFQVISTTWPELNEATLEATFRQQNQFRLRHPETKLNILCRLDPQS